MFRKMIAVVLAAMLITSAVPLSAFAAETEPDNGTVAAAETSELPTETEPAVAEPTEAVTIPPVQDEAARTIEEVTTQPVKEKKAEPVGASVDMDETVGKSSFTYTVSNDQVTITGLTDDTVTDLVIPDTIENMPVVAIKESAFNGCSQITSINVPNSVTSIGNGAFKGTNPTKVTLPFIGYSKTATGNTRIFGFVFGLVEKATKEYNLPESLIPADAIYANFRRYESNYYYYSCCYIPKTIKEVVITGDTSVPYQAFYGCSWIEKVYINDIEGDASLVGNNAFYNCKAMTVYINRDTAVHTYCERNGIKHCSTKSITLDNDSLVLFRNGTDSIGSEVILLNGNVDTAPETVWSSSDTSIATVDKNTGLISAVSPGTAIIMFSPHYTFSALRVIR